MGGKALQVQSSNVLGCILDASVSLAPRVDENIESHTYSSSTGLVGAAVGATLAVVRRQHVPLYTMGMFVNYSLFGSLFFGMYWQASNKHAQGSVNKPYAVVREGFMFKDPSIPRMNSTLAGSVAGGIATTLHGEYNLMTKKPDDILWLSGV